MPLFVPASREKSQPLAGLKFWPQLFEGEIFWQEITGRNTEDFCQEQQFAIRDAAQLRFELAHRAEADAPALQLKFLGKDGLRPSLAIAELPHLGADHVQTDFHQAETLTQSAAAFTPT